MDGQQKTALVTGASGGIGMELSWLLAKDGYNLVVVARNLEKLTKLKEEIESECRTNVTVIQKDLSQPSSAEEIFEFTKENKIRIDILVNNAGFGDWGFFAECNLGKIQSMIQLNVMALTTLTRLFLAQMKERNSGKIMNVASVASFMPGAKMAVYYATKAFVRSFSEAISVELKKTSSKVTVTALCPGPVETDFWSRAEAGESKIFSNFIFANQKEIALYGYRKMMKGSTLVVPGFFVKLSVLAAKLLPFSVVRNLIYRVQK